MPLWTVTIDGLDHIEVEAPNVEEAGAKGVKEWRDTITGRKERREIRVLVVVLNERTKVLRGRNRPRPQPPVEGHA
jgi:hypothetical protein